MATADHRDRSSLHQLRENPQQRYEGGFKTQGQGGGPTTSQILAVVGLLPVGGILLGLAGLTLVGTLIGLAVATPLAIICSPVLVPAAIGISLAVTGFLASGAFGLTALSSLSWLLNSLRQKMEGKSPLEYAQSKMQDAAEQLGQTTKDVGQTIQSKAQESGRDEKRVGRDN